MQLESACRSSRQCSVQKAGEQMGMRTVVLLAAQIEKPGKRHHHARGGVRAYRHARVAMQCCNAAMLNVPASASQVAGLIKAALMAPLLRHRPR